MFKNFPHKMTSAASFLAAGVMMLALVACGGGSGAGGGAPNPVQANLQPLTNIHQFVGDTWQFDASASTAPALGSIVKYTWDFDFDGVTLTPDALGVTVSHGYTVPGIYTVALEVEDDKGQTDRTTLKIQAWDATLGGVLVQLHPPAASLDFGSIVVGEPVYRTVTLFNNTATNIVFDSATSPVQWVTAPGFPASLTLVPQQASDVQLQFTAQAVGSFPGTFTFGSSGSGLSEAVSFTAQTTPGFLTAAPMLAGRRFHTATLLGDGRVLVVGGTNASQQELLSSELYNPASNTWTWGPPMSPVPLLQPGNVLIPGPRAFHTATLMNSGSVVVAGGQFWDLNQGKWIAHNSVLVYDPASNTWQSAHNLTDPRTRHVAVHVVAGGVERLVLIGGKFNPNDPTEALATADVLDFSGQKVAVCTLKSTWLNHAATALPDGRILIAGGVDPLAGKPGANGTGASTRVEILDPATCGSVLVNTGLTTPRYDLTLDAIAPTVGASTLFALGGANNLYSALASLEKYVGGPTAPFVMGSGGLLQARAKHRAVDLGAGRGLLVVGGVNASGALGSAEILAPSGGLATSAGGGLHTPRAYGHAVTRLSDGSVLVTGGVGVGAGDAAAALAEVERYLPTP